MSFILGEWREGKVRPVPGNAPHDRQASRKIVSPKSVCDDPLHTTRFPQLHELPGPSAGVFKAWRNLSVRCGFKNQPRAGNQPPPANWSRPEAEERAGRITLFSSSAMSSGRLFLDRVGRHQSPSPLRRHGQINMHFPKPLPEHDISTLLGGRHFYFALTQCLPALVLQAFSRYAFFCS